MPRQRGRAKHQPRPVLPGRRRPRLSLMFGAIAIVVVVFLLIKREHFAAEQERRATEQQPAPPSGTAGENWQKALGSWRRQTDGPGDTIYPYRFQFFENRSAQVVYIRADGSVQSRHSLVDILADERDQLSVQLRERDEKISLRFRLAPDGTLVLKAGDGDLVFSRP